jgi:wyosine [tRNA(Phe)-imidazoG37] synthetase (radical SAM superfamily)
VPESIQLQQGIIYGPVDSRRLGNSLGINLMPTRYKLCPFNCVYCQYGKTRIRTAKVEEYKDELPGPDQVAAALESVLLPGVDADYITFSGNGEPTFHPELGEIVDKVSELRDRYLKGADVCILSNSAFVWKEKVRQALMKTNVRIMKLDVGSEKDFNLINRPAEGVSFRKIIGGLRELTDYYIQTLFFDGEISNAGDEHIDKWIDLIGQLRPRIVQIYTLDRPAWEKGIRKVPNEKLSEIANRTTERTGVNVCVYGDVPREDVG